MSRSNITKDNIQPDIAAKLIEKSDVNVLGNSEEKLERNRGAAALATIAKSRNADRILLDRNNRIVNESYNRVLYGSSEAKFER